MGNSLCNFWRHAIGSMVVVAVVLITSTAHADESADQEWYGWQIMSVDATSFGLMGLGLGGNEPTALFLGYAGYALGGPIVHLAHEQRWESAGSLVLRLGLPLTGAAIANVLDSSGGGDFSAGGFANTMLGLAAGTVAAMALDYIFLAREPTSPSNSSSSQTQMLRLQLQF